MSYDAGTEARADCDTCNRVIFDGEYVHCGECHGAVEPGESPALADQLERWHLANSMLISKEQKAAVEMTLAAIQR